MAPSAEIHFKRLGVTLDQITGMSLPTRPTKASDSRAKGFGDISVELDAIAPDTLRSIVQREIERHLPPEQYEVLLAAEESERSILHSIVQQLMGGDDG